IVRIFGFRAVIIELVYHLCLQDSTYGTRIEYMTKRNDLIQLNRTGLWVPRYDAKQEAITVYSEFSMNMGNLEDASILSHVVHASFSPDEVKKYMSGEHQLRLTNKNYLAGTLGELASRITLKGNVTASMVVAEIDEGGIGGYIVEPFVGKSVLDEMHA